MKARSAGVALALIAAVLMTNACSKKLVKKTSGADKTAAGGQTEPSVHGAEFSGVPQLKPVHFEFDRHHLAGKARAILKANAEVIRRNKGWEVLVEGHCDQRGTVEYNLALGQKRAKAVRDYYLMLGIEASRIATLSYGREKPACMESTEECWGRNRRAENKVKTAVASAVGEPKR